MELDVLAFGESLIAHIPALRREAEHLTHEPESAHRLVRATVAKAWRGRPTRSHGDMGGWLGDLLRQEHSILASEPRTFQA